MATHCNEIVMIERSEPVKSGTQWTRLAALHPVKESNKVEHFQNAATSPCVLIIRRSLVRVQPPPPLQKAGQAFNRKERGDDAKFAEKSKTTLGALRDTFAFSAVKAPAAAGRFTWQLRPCYECRNSSVNSRKSMAQLFHVEVKPRQ